MAGFEVFLTEHDPLTQLMEDVETPKREGIPLETWRALPDSADA
ncbi:hypothetical protein [Rhodococcus qingshengii]|nr:hypothetical protein [Rhodococcus qingshengii]